MNKDTPEYHAIEKAAEKDANFMTDNEEGRLIRRLAFIRGALSPEAKAFHQRWNNPSEPPNTNRDVLIRTKGNYYIGFYLDGDYYTDFDIIIDELQGWQELPPAP